MKQIADAASFVARFAAGACTRSIPHIYISAVPFCAKSSSVYDNYWRYMRGLMEVEGRAMKEWRSAVIVVRETDAKVISVAFSPDGTRIVSGSNDRTIRVWDAHSGDVVAGPFEGHTSSVRSVAFSPDGTRIVSSSSDCTIRVWDARSGDVVAGPFEGHTDYVTSVAFSLDGTRILSGSEDRTIRVWDAHSGDIVAGPFEGHTSYVTSVADGTRILSGSENYTIRGLTHAKHNHPIFHTPHPLSHLKHFVFKQDGWITVDNYPFFWISPPFRPYLPFPSNAFVIGPQGNISITYPPHLNVGTMWPSCFAPHT